MEKNDRILGLAPPSTVGGAGLSLRYATVILFAERCLYTPATIGEEARGVLYEMLPAKLKQRIKAKLRRHWHRKQEEEEEEEEEVSREGHFLADGWREALEEIMDWLSPMAHDTVRWQTERSLEKQKFERKPTVMLLQTLHYSDLEKTEAAIVEVLVGLSCMFRYERWRSNTGRHHGHRCR